MLGVPSMKTACFGEQHRGYFNMRGKDVDFADHSY